MTMLNEEGLKAANAAVNKEWQTIVSETSPHMSPGDIARSFVTPGNHRLLRAAITAYLSTVEKPVDKWAVDNSTPSPILTYENCSVIQDEQAYYVLDLVRSAAKDELNTKTGSK